MNQILARVPIFVGFVFLIVLATAAPVLALAVLVGAAVYAMIDLHNRQLPELRRVRVHARTHKPGEWRAERRRTCRRPSWDGERGTD